MSTVTDSPSLEPLQVVLPEGSEVPGAWPHSPTMGGGWEGRGSMSPPPSPAKGWGGC